MLKVYYNGDWHTITGHVHSHPNYGGIEPGTSDIDMAKYLNGLPCIIIGHEYTREFKWENNQVVTTWVMSNIFYLDCNGTLD